MTLYAIDIESGGFKEKEHALLSIALVEVLDPIAARPPREIELYCLPEPGKIITDDAAKVNGYTPELWAERGAKPLLQQLLALGQWLLIDARAPGDIIDLVAHNAPFDRRFMEASEKALCVPITSHEMAWKCSLELFRNVCRNRKWFPPNHKLESLAHMSGHWSPGYVRGDHLSLADARACAAGWTWLQDPHAKFVPFANPTAPIIGHKS